MATLLKNDTNAHPFVNLSTITKKGCAFVSEGVQTFSDFYKIDPDLNASNF
jgi:hypothetical protein